MQRNLFISLKPIIQMDFFERKDAVNRRIKQFHCPDGQYLHLLQVQKEVLSSIS
jgi:hypothetical protein